MAQVRRANVILDVKEDQVQRYLDMGYDVIDEQTGNVVKASVPRDVKTLQIAYEKHIREIEELKLEIKKLKSKPVRSNKSKE